MNKILAGRDLMRRIKPVLAELPIRSAELVIPVSDIAELNVTFIVNEELLLALTNKENKDNNATAKKGGGWVESL